MRVARVTLTINEGELVDRGYAKGSFILDPDAKPYRSAVLCGGRKRNKYKDLPMRVWMLDKLLDGAKKRLAILGFLTCGDIGWSRSALRRVRKTIDGVGSK